MISTMRISSNNSSIIAAAIAACDKFLIDLFPSRLAPTGPSRNSDLGSKKVMER
ncbi:hypothetical protein HYV85_04170 [Candidatus Woesearchaeota archaeon]|nr:hypothetical protein [Candidatus Woesearchaeota archaeon]